MGTRTWVGLAIIMSLWATNLAVAADWSLVPAINLKTDYNSNINTTSTGSTSSTGSAGKLSDFIFTISPSAAFSYATEASRLQGTIGINQLLYVKNTGYNHTDQNYQINGQYALTPRFNISLSTSFISDSTSQEELLASGLVITRTPRLSFFVIPGISYNLTERLSASLNYNFNKVTYQPVKTSQVLNSQNYQDYSTQVVGLTWQYLLSERTTASTTFSGTETTYTGPNANDYKSFLASLGISHKFSERWQFNAAAGVNYSLYTNDNQIATGGQFPNFVSVPTQQQKGTGFSPNFNLGATRRWTKLSITGSFSRNQQASAYGYVSQVNALSLSINCPFTERLSGSLGGSYSLSSQSSNTTQNRNNNYNIGPQLRYLITERLSASSTYTFSNQSYQGNNISGTNNNSGANNAQVHIISLMLTYAYPIHYQK
jgi:hypothetical protein